MTTDPIGHSSRFALLRFGCDESENRCLMAIEQSAQVFPWMFPSRPFLDARNHKPPTFSRKIRGLCLLNVAVKERFELSIQFLVYTLSRRAP